MWTLAQIHSFAPQFVSTSCIARCCKDLALYLDWQSFCLEWAFDHLF